MNTRTKLFILSATLIAITMITGCNKTQESTTALKPIGAEVKDSEVTDNVKTALLLDEKTKNLAITVVTLKGDVKLTGVLDDQSQIDYVGKLVRNTQGVHSIHDELSIKK